MAVGFVQQRGTTGTEVVADGGTFAYNSNVTAGNLLVAVVGVLGGATLVNGITDSQGNTWTAAIQHQSSNRTAAIFYAIAGSSGACTLTFDWASAGNNQVNISEYSGFPNGVTAGPTDGESNSNADPCLCGEITTTGEAVLVNVMAHDSGYTVSSRLTDWQGLDGGIRISCGYKLSASGETTTGAVDFTQVESCAAAIAAFYPTAGSGGSTILRQMMQYYG